MAPRLRVPQGAVVRVVGWALALVVAFIVVRTFARNEHMQWSAVAKYLFSRPILEGLWATIELTSVAAVISLLVGMVLVAIGESGPVGKAVVAAYVWLFRSIPLIVQLLFWFNLALVLPRVTIVLPGAGTLLDLDTNDLITGFVAAMLGLAIHEGAYVAEILRGGLLAIPSGQHRAAAALGMTPVQAYRHIIGPQIARVTVPALTNQFVGLLKATSLVAVIGGGELLTRAMWIYAQNFQVVPLLIVVTIWYVVLVGAATVGQYFIERRFAPGGPRGARRRLQAGTEPARTPVPQGVS